MKIVLVGCGKFGIELTQLLLEEGHDVTVIDSNEATIERVSSTLDVLAVCGSGADYNVLDEVDTDKADVCIACTANDEVNMLVSCLARQMGTKYTVARLRGLIPGTKAYEFIKKELRLNLVVSPDYQTAQDIFKMLTAKQVNKVMILGATRIAVYLSSMLDEANVEVTVLDRDEKRCTYLCNNVSSEVTVINDQHTNHKALQNAELSHMDALVTLSTMDEENILTSLYATECKVPTVVTKIEKASYTNIVQDLGLVDVFSPRTSSSKMILDYVRRIKK